MQRKPDLGPGRIFCRSCANFIGRRAGLERRGVPQRLCAAGLDGRAVSQACPSFVVILREQRNDRRNAPRSPSQPGDD